MYKVMIIDDEPFVVEGMKSLINWNEYGFSICCDADNGEDALKKAVKYNPDLIITDINLPEMNGLQFIQRCIEEYKLKSKYVIISGYDEFEYARTAMKYGVLGYILKPIDEDEIIESLIKVKNAISSEKQDMLANTLEKKAISTILKKYIKDEISISKNNVIERYLRNYDQKEFRYFTLSFTRLQQHRMINEAGIVENIVMGILDSNADVFFVQEELGKRNIYGAIFPERNINSLLMEDSDALYKFAQTLSDKIYSKAGYRPTIYIGKKVNGLINIKDSKFSCIRAEKDNFIYDRQDITICDNVAEVNYVYKAMDDETSKQLIECIEKNDCNSIKANIENIYYTIRNALYEPEIVKAGIADFLIEIIKLLRDMKCEKSELFRTIAEFNMEGMVLKEIKEQLVTFCIQTAELINTLRSNNNKGILSEVQKYIELNYDKDIKLKDISKIFYINSTYLGKVFKKNIGISFNEYLNKIRIEKAKKLLISENYKVCKISQMVGYNDVNYFINKFEELTDKTPSEYKRTCAE
ncbi:response regulator [Clostridium oryzae]|uniref:Stage 0 sporulation protein A homolog n=1 Tax=Clostridium oryzae TaxID=1450648 RepID=A0A1V4I9D1_9CLOT|nr:response regulator [Clostridium oryzae]OPJ56608.1 putative response regulatory protein [Clostridium oryzae]